MRQALIFSILRRFGNATLIGGALLSTACQTPNLTLNRTSPAELLVAPLRQPGCSLSLGTTLNPFSFLGFTVYVSRVKSDHQ